MYLSSLAYPNTEIIEFINRAHELGFNGVEIIVEGFSENEIENAKEVIEELDLRVSLHAPFSDINIASLNSGIRNESLRQIKRSIDLADYLSADSVTLHSGRISPLSMRFKEKAWELNINSLRILARYAKKRDIKLCLENSSNYYGLFCCRIDEVREVLESVENLHFTLDVGHANTCNSVFEFLEFIERTINIHLHDNNGKNDEHLAVGEGNIDFEKFFRELRKREYRGIITVETLNDADVVKSLEILKKYL